MDPVGTDRRRRLDPGATVPGVEPARATPASGTAVAIATRPSVPFDVQAEADGGLAPGAVIDQYELIRELGRGGMGVVFAARDMRLGRRVAIKFVLHASREVAERFLVEARATAQCSHENIVIIHAVDEYAGMPYMVLEFLEGATLRGLMDTQLQLAPSRVVELMLPVARALTRAHELGIVHRDLKPDNVFVTTNGQVKVLDFGIAKALGATDASGSFPRAPTSLDSTQADVSTMVGTLAYMAPEQMGMDTIDHRADLWAAGTMMFEMLSGRHPVDPPHAQALINNAASDEPMPSLAVVEPSTPAALAEIVDACSIRPKLRRLPSAHVLATRLEALLPGRSGRALADGESPYPGLSAFQEADANRFFGRAREVTRMVAKIREQPLTGVVGPSGAGKSSFVRAGVGPALKASGEPWNIVTLRPGRRPLAALATVVHKLSFTGPHESVSPNEARNHEALARRLSIEPGYLGVALRACARRSGGNILLFVDQLEELYTLVPDAAERRAFTAALAGVADDSAAPLRVVVSMRSDFLDRLAEDPRFVDELARGLVFVGALDDGGLREALIAPIDMVGYRFETQAMVDDMLRELASAPSALPLLQFASAKLWDARDRERRMLTLASYRAIGGISGALATHANDVLASMDVGAQRLAQKLFRALVTPEHTRAIVELADLVTLAPDRAEVTRVLDQLVAARLLVVQTRSEGGSSVEIVHESLIDRWPTLLRWLEEDQEDDAFSAQISAAAKQWHAKHRTAGMLWRGAAARDVQRWLATRPRELAERDRAFVDAVVALDRRGARARRVALIGAFVLMAGVATGASVAYLRVDAAEALAHKKQLEAEDRNLKAEAAAAARERAIAAQHEADEKANRAVADKNSADAALGISNESLKASQARLVDENKRLVDALKAADEATQRAERATQDARKAAADADQAKRALQVDVLAKQRAIDELEN